MDISDYREHIKNMRANNIRNYINRSNAHARGEEIVGGVAGMSHTYVDAQHRNRQPSASGVRRMDSLPKPMVGINQPPLSMATSSLGNSISGMGMGYRIT
jgi:hypothetical protein